MLENRLMKIEVYADDHDAAGRGGKDSKSEVA